MKFTATTVLTLRKQTNNLKTISLNYSKDFDELPNNSDYVSKLFEKLILIQSEMPIINEYSIEFINQEKIENLTFKSFIDQISFGDSSYDLKLMSMQPFERILQVLLNNLEYKSYGIQEIKHIELTNVIDHPTKSNRSSNASNLVIHYKPFKKRTIQTAYLSELMNGDLDSGKIIMVGETPIIKNYRGEILRKIFSSHPELTTQPFIIMPQSYNYNNRYATFGSEWLQTQEGIVDEPKWCPLTRQIENEYRYTFDNQNLKVITTVLDN